MAHFFFIFHALSFELKFFPTGVSIQGGSSSTKAGDRFFSNF